MKAKKNQKNSTDIRYCAKCNEPKPMADFPLNLCGIRSIVCKKCKESE